MRKIFSLGLVLLAVFVSGSFFTPIYAEDDTTPPVGTILINDGALYTNTRDVTLTLSATDDVSEIAEIKMKFNNGTGVYSTPESYSTTKLWTLSASGDGLKTVRVKFIDQALNENTPGIPATITLDTVVPVITLLGEATINLNIGDTYEDAGATALDNDADDLTSSIVTVNPLDANTAGTYTITYNVTDPAGNDAIEVTRTVIVNATPESEEEEGEDLPLSIEENITLKNGCEVVDTDGKTHIFPKEDSTSEYLAICALQEVLDQNFVDDIDFADFGFGLFVSSVNGISQENTYWQLRKNDISASVGSAQLTLESNDTVSLVLTAFDPDTFAETTLDDSVKITIESLDPAFNNIILLDRCTIIDNEGQEHIFPKEDSPSEYLAICALAEALDRSIVDDIEFVDFGFGIFVDNFNNLVKPENSYWKFYLNTEGASVGIAQSPIEKGNTVSFILTEFDPVTFDEEAVEPNQSVKVRIIELASSPAEEEEEIEETPPPSGGSGGGGSGGGTSTSTFSAPNALAYLKNVQAADGSFDNSSRYTDWVAVSFGAMNETGTSRDLLLSYLNSNNIISAIPTDNQRRVMALLALGQNPYSFNGVDYIKAIVDSFNENQFGNTGEDNDDIFALIVLQKAGYTKNDEIINDSISFVLNRQRENGSWDESVDMTGAGIQALATFNSVSGVSNAIEKAKTYLKNTQSCNDGGWGNVFSTSWAMQAESALKTSFNTNCKTGLDYLTSQQSTTSGAVSPSLDTFATSSAIAAASGKSWSEIMQAVSKPEISESETAGGSSGSLVLVDEPEENTGAEIPASLELVICAPGDLFSTATGEPCARAALADLVETNLPQANSPAIDFIRVDVRSPSELFSDAVPLSNEIVSAADVYTAEEKISLPVAAGGASGAQVPVAVAIVMAAIAGGFVLFRFIY